VFIKARMVCDLLKRHIGEVSGDELLTILCHLHHHHRNRRKEPLTEKEMIVYDILLKENINPHTAYYWLCITKTPEDVRKGLFQNKLPKLENFI
jgi:hypothetical protein